MNIYRIGVLLVAFGASACGASPTAPTPATPTPTPTPIVTPTPAPASTTHVEAFTIRGAVTDGTSGGVLPGIAVAWNGRTTLTDSDGHYAIGDVPGGPLTLTFSAESYVPQIQTLAVEASATLDVMLQRTPGAPPTVPRPTVFMPTIACVGLLHGQPTVCTITNVASAADLIAAEWSFGDGQLAATYPQAQHVYTQPGTYTVDVVATPRRGGQGTGMASATITIS